MKNYAIAMLSLSMASCVVGEHGMTPLSTVSVTVVDEGGQPIEGARLEWGYFNSGDYGDGFTDSLGTFTFSGRALGTLGCNIERDGYYPSNGRLWRGNQNNPRPPSAFTIPLKRIINPVEMIHRTVETELPRLNEPAGFDLMVGDWVAPYGKGERADVFFEGEKSFEGKLSHQERHTYATKLTVTFPHERDGMQGLLRPKGLDLASRLPVPQLAPLEGYKPVVELVSSRQNGGQFTNYRNARQIYMFRVRVVVDSRGEIDAANYGYINGFIKGDFFEFDTMWLSFEYYLNPDPDPEARSLEPASLAARK